MRHPSGGGRTKIGANSPELVDSTAEQLILKFQRILATYLQHHYRTVKEELIQEQKLVSATVLVELYKKIILSRQYSSITSGS